MIRNRSCIVQEWHNFYFIFNHTNIWLVLLEMYCPGFTSHCTGLDCTLPLTRYSSSSGNDSHTIIGSPKNYAVTIASPTNHFVVLGTYIQFDNGTRMHSIRMRTIHRSGHPGGGVYPKGGVYPGVYTPPVNRMSESQTGVKTLSFRNFVCGR